MTAPQVNDAARLAAEGVPIPTRRGLLPLLYGFRALRALEDQFGSIQGMQDAMQALLDSMTTDGRGRAFGPMADIIVPGLLHTGLTRDQAEDALLPGQVKVYVEAMQTAMQLAFPEAEPAAASPGNGEAPAPLRPPAHLEHQPAGPGQSGTTWPQGATAAPQTSSGA